MGITKTDQLILTAIICDVEIVKSNNIHELSSILYVSASSITKACKKFGYEGYKEMQHRIRCEDEYKYKNIIRLTIDVNEILVSEFLANGLNYKKWVTETRDKIYKICLKVYGLPESQLQEVLISSLTKIMFYLLDSSTSVRVLSHRKKVITELSEHGLLVKF